MTNFNYVDGIPASNHNPSTDQPSMLINFTSIKQILDVDHVTFGNSNGGTHNQITYSSVTNPLTPSDPISIAFTKNDSNNHPNQYFINSQGTFLLSCVKAFGTINTNVSPAFLNQFNAVSVSYTVNPNPTYTVTLATNAVTGNNVCIFVMPSQSPGVSITYSFANPVLTITSNRVLPENGFMNFIVLQA